MQSEKRGHLLPRSEAASSLRSSSLSARIIKHDIIRLASMHGCVRVRVRSKNAQVRSRLRHGSATTLWEQLPWEQLRTWESSFQDKLKTWKIKSSLITPCTSYTTPLLEDHFWIGYQEARKHVQKCVISVVLNSNVILVAFHVCSIPSQRIWHRINVTGAGAMEYSTRGIVPPSAAIRHQCLQSHAAEREREREIWGGGLGPS